MYYSTIFLFLFFVACIDEEEVEVDIIIF